MKRPLAPLALLALAGAAAGCGENPQSIGIVGFGPITTDTASGSCLTPLPTTTTFTTLGFYDVAVRPAPFGYLLSPIVENDLAVTGSQISIERNNFTLTGYEVQLVKRVGKFTQPALQQLAKVHTIPVGSLRVAPGGSIARGSVTVEAFPSSLIPDFAAELNGDPSFDMVIRGRLVGTVANNVMKSATTDFPITICERCLTGTIGPCPVPKPVNGFCNPPQDEPITCCKDGDTVLCGSASGK